MGAIVFLAESSFYVGTNFLADFCLSQISKQALLTQVSKASSPKNLADILSNIFPFLDQSTFSFLSYSALKVLWTGSTVYLTHHTSFYSFDVHYHYLGKLKFLLITYPLNVVLTKMRAGEDFLGLIGGVFQLASREGFGSLYRGFLFAVIEYGIFAWITFNYREWKIKKMKEKRIVLDNGKLANDVIIADIIARVVTYPFCVLKNRSIVSNGETLGFKGLYDTGLFFMLFVDYVKNIMISSCTFSGLNWSANC